MLLFEWPNLPIVLVFLESFLVNIFATYPSLVSCNVESFFFFVCVCVFKIVNIIALCRVACRKANMCARRGQDNSCSDPVGRALQETRPRLSCSQERGGEVLEILSGVVLQLCV